ncbi:MAG: hypothetical protein ACNA8H_02040 [Anaerolineales bacterium]
MKILIDRTKCNVYDPACEAHFGWHFLREEITPVDCTLEVIDDGRPERTFVIKDKDGLEKVLVVDDDNLAEAYDSWILAWEKERQVQG